MKEQKDEKWLDETISRATDFGEVEFDAEKWREKYILKKSNEASCSHVKLKPHYNIWRFIMENRITRYSAAAVVALAAALVLFGPFGTSKNGGIVLADVKQKVAEFETMVLRGQKTFLRPGEPGDVFEFDGMKCKFDLVKYFSKQHGFTEEGYVEDNLIYRITFNLPKRQTLIVFPPHKKYVTFTSTDDVAKIMETVTTPNGFFNLLLESDYKELGRDNIDGVEVEGFEFQNVEPIKEIFPKVVFDIQDYTGKVWIGIEEQLPVRLESDLVIGKSFMTMFNDLNLHEVNVLDKYNVELDEDIFDTNAPEGYTEFTLSDILSLIPLEAKASLDGLSIASAGFVFVVRQRRRKKRATTDPH